MAAPLTDDDKALRVAKEVHSFLGGELQMALRSQTSRTTVFAAFLGLMRSCNPLHKRRKALRSLAVQCPLVQRFPEVLTGKLLWYKDVEVSLRDVVERGGPVLDERKMWRLLVWIWLGNGGHLHQAWRHLERLPCCQRYKPGDLRQPLEVIRFVIHAVHVTGALMKVIGSDGLDKKSRLGRDRILYLCRWHEAVPALVEAFGKGAVAFDKAISRVQGLRGDLTRKEILILFAASRYKTFQRVGAPTLPFGQGAKNGAKAFLGIQQRKGPGATAYYHKKLMAKIPFMEAAIARFFPRLDKEDRRVTLGDIEPCLCAAFVYSGLVSRLRKHLQEGQKTTPRRLLLSDKEKTWQAVEKLAVPAGFYAYGRDGRPLGSASGSRFPRPAYAKFKLDKVPPKSFLTKSNMLRGWGPAPGEPQAKRRLEAGARSDKAKRRRVSGGRRR